MKTNILNFFNNKEINHLIVISNSFKPVLDGCISDISNIIELSIKKTEYNKLELTYKDITILLNDKDSLLPIYNLISNCRLIIHAHNVNEYLNIILNLFLNYNLIIITENDYNIDEKVKQRTYLLKLDSNLPKLNCVVMASGFSKRFKENKLLKQIDGISLFEKTLKQLPFSLINEVIVVTRYQEIAVIAQKYPVKVCMHNMINNSDTIKLGINNLTKAKSTMFITCDQPLRRKESIIKMINLDSWNNKIIRLKYQERVSNPIIFPDEYNINLLSLEGDETGRKLIDENILYVEALDEKELIDIDRQEDYQNVLNIK